MLRFPYFGFPSPYYRNYRYYPPYHVSANQQDEPSNGSTSSKSNNYSKSNVSSTTLEEKENNNNRSTKEEEAFFDLFGLKLHYDDILLVSLIYFLYNEGVKDEGLFLALILLLLT